MVIISYRDNNHLTIINIIKYNKTNLWLNKDNNLNINNLKKFANILENNYIYIHYNRITVFIYIFTFVFQTLIFFSNNTCKIYDCLIEKYLKVLKKPYIRI